MGFLFQKVFTNWLKVIDSKFLIEVLKFYFTINIETESAHPNLKILLDFSTGIANLNNEEFLDALLMLLKDNF